MTPRLYSSTAPRTILAALAAAPDGTMASPELAAVAAPFWNCANGELLVRMRVAMTNLERRGWVVRAGKQRTASGHLANVWSITANGREALNGEGG